MKQRNKKSKSLTKIALIAPLISVATYASTVDQSTKDFYLHYDFLNTCWTEETGQTPVSDLSIRRPVITVEKPGVDDRLFEKPEELLQCGKDLKDFAKKVFDKLSELIEGKDQNAVDKTNLYTECRKKIAILQDQIDQALYKKEVVLSSINRFTYIAQQVKVICDHVKRTNDCFNTLSEDSAEIKQKFINLRKNHLDVKDQEGIDQVVNEIGEIAYEYVSGILVNNSESEANLEKLKDTYDYWLKNKTLGVLSILFEDICAYFTILKPDLSKIDYMKTLLRVNNLENLIFTLYHKSWSLELEEIENSFGEAFKETIVLLGLIKDKENVRNEWRNWSKRSIDCLNLIKNGLGSGKAQRIEYMYKLHNGLGSLIYYNDVLANNLLPYSNELEDAKEIRHRATLLLGAIDDLALKYSKEITSVFIAQDNMSQTCKIFNDFRSSILEKTRRAIRQGRVKRDVERKFAGEVSEVFRVDDIKKFNNLTNFIDEEEIKNNIFSSKEEYEEVCESLRFFAPPFIEGLQSKKISDGIAKMYIP